MIKAFVVRPAEAERWTVVFHRKAENWIFGLIAMGRFKHVSAFAWLPDVQRWLVYDVGFRRTRIVVLPDTIESRAHLARVITGNAIVTMPVRTDAMPVMRLGLFCTSAIKHLIGLPGGALRPDALFASCLRHGGELSDDAGAANSPTDRPKSGGRAATGSAAAGIGTANAGAG